MPDQPDDARKRPQRGVFPPFFAPRNGRGESSPTPHSGSWRRVSRLFTPPEVARQRRTPAAPQLPYTPPVASPEADVAAKAPAEATEKTTEAAEARLQPAEDALDAVVRPAPEVLSQPAVELPESIAPSGVPEEDLASTASLGLEEAAADELAHFDPMAFDEEADRFVVESLEPEPISLAPSELERLDVEFDSLDSVVPSSSAAPGDDSVIASAPHELVESMERYLADDSIVVDTDSYLADDSVVVDEARELESMALSDDATLVDSAVDYSSIHDDPAHPYEETALEYDAPAVADGAVILPGAEEVNEVVGAHDALGAESEAPLAYDLGAQPTEADPWAGAELPEPAFGSIGWPSSEIAALAAEPPVDCVDEMSAALAWSEAEEEGAAAGHAALAAEANGADASSDDDALSAMAHELRDSSSAWVTGGDARVRDDADLSARARFYGGADAGTPPGEAEISTGGGSYAAELAAAEAAGREAIAAGDDAGAAIADALARVAARIRAGEVELPSEAVGASDESALAAALAALLRGPRR